MTAPGSVVVVPELRTVQPEHLGADGGLELLRGEGAHRYQAPFTLICWPVM